jgi:hypothetical protein
MGWRFVVADATPRHLKSVRRLTSAATPIWDSKAKQADRCRPACV